MEVIVLIIHLLVCICLIGLVLLQRSEGGALGIGGGGGGSLMSGRGASDALARMTSVAGGFFLVTSLSLTFLSGAAASSSGASVIEDFLQRREQSAPAPAPAQPEPVQPAPERPDPTESSLPARTQLASTAAPGPVEAAPPGAARAAPLTSSPPRPAATQPAAETTRRPAPPQRRAASDSAPAPATPEPLQIPNTSGAVSGVNLTDDDPSATESIDIGSGVEAVRRERAGPDR